MSGGRQGTQPGIASRWAGPQAQVLAQAADVLELQPRGHVQPGQPADVRQAPAFTHQHRRQVDQPLVDEVGTHEGAVQRGAGFQVQLLANADHRRTLAALRDFGDRLRQAQVGVFYFAGHGMQIKGRNYLIPVDAEIEREDEVAYGALDAQAVLDKMDSAGNGLNLMILDACRNNPFARSFRSAAQGLAQMDAPVGSFVAFATAPGSWPATAPVPTACSPPTCSTSCASPG